MPIIFKPVGYIKTTEIKLSIIGPVRLSNIISLFTNFGLQADDFKSIRFIINLETLSDNMKVYNVGINDNLIIFVFSNDDEVKRKLTTIFQKNASTVQQQPQMFNNTFETFINQTNAANPAAISYANIVANQQMNQMEDQQGSPTCDVDSDLTKPVVDKIDDDKYILTDETICMMNAQTVNLFADNDFKSLVKIYNTNPNILKKFLNFVSHGDIVKMTIPVLDPPKNYTNEMLQLKKLGVIATDDEILSTLQSFNGQLNLSLRVLLTKQ